MSTPLNVEMHLDADGSDPVVIIEGVDVSAHVRTAAISFDSEDGCLVALSLYNCQINMVPAQVPGWMEEVEELEDEDEDEETPGT